MSQALTSIIIPAFNSASTLAKALRSALSQQPPPLEVIVVDDGSSDTTEFVARRFESQIRYISQANAGPAAARNAGLRAARGEFVAFLDADDYWLPGFVHKCQEFLRCHPQAAAVSVALKFIRVNGSSFSLPKLTRPTEPMVIENFFDFWATHDHIRTGSCMIRREILEKGGLQLENLRLCEDLEYWGYLATFGKWGFLPEVLWVCDSERAAARSGWIRKYQTRRELCPSVEAWQARILPRLSERDIPGFIKVRGRIAASLAHNLVLAHKRKAAREMIRKYGHEMPRTWSSTLMRKADKSGRLGWRVACYLISLRETQKAIFRSFLSPPDVVGSRTAEVIEPSYQAPPSSYIELESGESVGVSVIIPVFDAAHCLEKAIESALNQTMRPLEVIVVNDGSTDSSSGVIRKFRDRIIYMEQENRGQGAARNTGLKQARGELIAFLDADDYWQPGFIFACVRFLQTHPEAIAVSTGLRFNQSNGAHTTRWEMPSSADDQKAKPWVLNNFFAFWATHDHVRTGSNVIRRNVIEKAGYQQEHLSISQDLEYWGFLATFGPWGFIPEILWNCNSEPMAVSQGWLRKYRKRRKFCPTVDQWQQRIVPRLRPGEWPGFKRVRGRTAASYAQNQIISGRWTSARTIIHIYGDELPISWLSTLLRKADKLGSFGWRMACLLVQGREFQKAFRMRLHRPVTFYHNLRLVPQFSRS